MKKILLLAAAIFSVALFAANGKIRVYITRHGQPGRPGLEMGDVVPLPGHSDPPLTKLGQQQAHCLGKFLKSEGFKGKVFASPYLRSVDTAVCVAMECGVKVSPDARFQERAGRKGKPNIKNQYTLADFLKVFPGLIDENCGLANDWPLIPEEPEGYTKEQKDRLMKGLDEVMKQFPGEDILIAGHAGTLTGFKTGFEERMGKKIKGGTGWNASLYAWEIDTKTGEITYIGYRIDYMPMEIITSNTRAKLSDKPKKYVKGWVTK